MTPRPGRRVEQRGHTTVARSFDRFYRDGVYRGWVVFLETLLATLTGMLCGFLLFPRETSLVSLFLLSIYQAPTVKGLFDLNRSRIFFAGVAPGLANRSLLSSLAVIFLGVFTAYLLAVQALPEGSLGTVFASQLAHFRGISLHEIQFPGLADLVRNNGLILVGCFLTALIYRHGGMIFVLAWNAAHWGAVLSFAVRSTLDGSRALDLLARTLLAFAPHLILEGLAYILAAMAGVFLSRALARHRIDSETFAQVGSAVLGLLAAALLALALAGLLESRLAPFFLRKVLSSSA